MNKTIEFSLDPSSIDMAIREVNQFEYEFLERLNDLIRTLVDAGVMIASIQVAVMDAVDTGELQHSFAGYYDDSTRVGWIRCNCLYGIFVEYGTGVVGASGPQHPPFDPEIDAAWVPDGMGHGTTGWYYQDDKDGSWQWTRGQMSRPFFYEMYKELQANSNRIALEVFGRQ